MILDTEGYTSKREVLIEFLESRYPKSSFFFFIFKLIKGYK